MSFLSPLFLAILSFPQDAPPRPDCSHVPPSTAPAATANDNRSPAGTLRGGVLALDLVLQNITWYPEGEGGCGFGMFGFAEEGRPPQTPAPLIRVPVGTRMRVRVRNALDTPMTMRGLQDHLTDSLSAFAGVEVQPGSTHSFEFQVTYPGTYFYHATLAMTPVGFVQAANLSQAVGAFVVDPAEGSRPDRIFVMTRWRGPMPSAARTQGWEITAFNGRSWPHTERLTATVGDSLRWRIISANNDGHSMHLHGFYFEVEAKGTLARDTVYAPERRRTSVTEPFGPGRTMSILWIPERPGNWIFHCHLMRHMSAAQRIDRMPDAAGSQLPLDASHESHALHEMAGLVLGITVDPRPGVRAEREATPRRTLQLFANRRENVFGAEPGFGFILQEGATPPAADSVHIPGSLLLLRRGEPTQITVTNRIGRPLAVHWHGLELDSYYDGVAGWSGMGERIAPTIAPGGTFDAHITPPRAGTCIYHVHTEHAEELPSGLYGPLLVLAPDARYDPERDLLFVVSEAGPGQVVNLPRAPFVNGTTQPDTLHLVAGRTYRLRIITIPANNVYEIRLERGGRLEEWRLIALDGADIPVEFQRMEAALLRDPSAGETFDLEFRPTASAELTLVFEPRNPGNPLARLTPTVVPIRVSAP